MTSIDKMRIISDYVAIKCAKTRIVNNIELNIDKTIGEIVGFDKKLNQFKVGQWVIVNEQYYGHKIGNITFVKQKDINLLSDVFPLKGLPQF